MDKDQYDSYIIDSIAHVKVSPRITSIVDPATQTLYTVSLYKKLEEQYALAHIRDLDTKEFDFTQKGYEVTLINDNGGVKTYKANHI